MIISIDITNTSIENIIQG